jgi:hypothetical protein
MADIKVKVDDRARLVTAVLAASTWPDEEQAQLTHAVHPHAKQTRHFVSNLANHPAVVGMNQAWLNGVELDSMFSAAARCQWPSFITTPRETLPRVLQIEGWTQSLAKFARDTNIANLFWPQHQAIWDAATAEMRTIFQNNHLLTFIEQVKGTPIPQTVQVMPNLVYPALRAVLATSNQTLYLLIPPPKAVGESPPWPYSEDHGWVIAFATRKLLHHIFAEELHDLEDEQQQMFIHAVTVLALEHTLDEFEGQAYLLRHKKEDNLPGLPDLVEKLRAYIGSDSAQTIASLF